MSLLVRPLLRNMIYAADILAPKSYSTATKQAPVRQLSAQITVAIPVLDRLAFQKFVWLREVLLLLSHWALPGSLLITVVVVPSIPSRYGSPQPACLRGPNTAWEPKPQMLLLGLYRAFPGDRRRTYR